jgi:hypothetical protein
MGTVPQDLRHACRMRQARCMCILLKKLYEIRVTVDRACGGLLHVKRANCSAVRNPGSAHAEYSREQSRVGPKFIEYLSVNSQFGGPDRQRGSGLEPVNRANGCKCLRRKRAESTIGLFHGTVPLRRSERQLVGAKVHAPQSHARHQVDAGERFGRIVRCVGFAGVANRGRDTSR